MNPHLQVAPTTQVVGVDRTLPVAHWPIQARATLRNRRDTRGGTV